MKSTADQAHAERIIEHGKKVEAEQLAADLAATHDWILIQSAAVAGLRLQIATELEGIDVDRRLGNTARVTAREERLVLLRRAAETARAWHPIRGEVPRQR